MSEGEKMKQMNETVCINVHLHAYFSISVQSTCMREDKLANERNKWWKGEEKWKKTTCHCDEQQEEDTLSIKDKNRQVWKRWDE